MLYTVKILIACWCIHALVPDPKIYYREVGFIECPNHFPDTLILKGYNDSRIYGDDVRTEYIIYNFKGKASFKEYRNNKLVAEGMYEDGRFMEEDLPISDPFTGIYSTEHVKYYLPLKNGEWHYYDYY